MCLILILKDALYLSLLFFERAATYNYFGECGLPGHTQIVPNRLIIHIFGCGSVIVSEELENIIIFGGYDQGCLGMSKVCQKDNISVVNISGLGFQ